MTLLSTTFSGKGTVSMKRDMMNYDLEAKAQLLTQKAQRSSADTEGEELL